MRHFKTTAIAWSIERTWIELIRAGGVRTGGF